MKLPLTRQKRTEENRLVEAQQLLNEIEAARSQAKHETAKFADEGISLAFSQSIERRASALGMTADELLSDYSRRLRESKYPTPECLQPEEVQMIADSGERTPEQARHLENCEACAQLVLKSTAVAPSHLEKILSEIRGTPATEAQTIFPEKASSAAAGFAETAPDDSPMALASNQENTIQAPRETRGSGLLKLVLADDQAIFRAGIAKELAVEDDLHIVAQAQTPEQMFMALDKFRAAVLLVAGGFYGDFGAVLEAAHRNKTRVVVVADSGENAQRYVRAGANGVVYRNATGAALVDCVRKVAGGLTWATDIAAGVGAVDSDRVGPQVRDRLTAKELRIVALVVQGYKNKEIAAELGTTEQVIKNYLRNVYDKIGVSDRLEVALFMIRHRVFSQESVGAAVSSRAFESVPL